MRALRAFLGQLRTLSVSVALLIVLAGITVARLFYASSVRRSTSASAAPAASGARTNGAAVKAVTEEFGQTFANFVLPPESPKKADEGPPPMPEDVKRQLVSSPTPISLFPPLPLRPKPAIPVPPIYYLPSFRMIRCELVTGPATGEIETPLIGIVVENQYAIDPDGTSRLVIPAGVEVHGTGRPSPVRDRIDGTGAWTFVWRTNDENNAMELTVSALALNRDYDDSGRVYGDTEKSPGISGRRFEAEGGRVAQEALLSSAAAMVRELKSSSSVLNPLTSQVVNQPNATPGNALLEGAAAGTERIADMFDAMRRQIDEKGYYVAVMPGKEFYLYTKEPIDLRKARRPQALSSGEPDAGSSAPRDARMNGAVGTGASSRQ